MNSPCHKRAEVWHLLFLGVGWSVLAASAARPSDTAQVQPRNAEDVIRLIENQRSRIHSLLVSYETHMEIDPQLLKEGRLGGVMTDTKATFAFAGDKRHVTSEGVGIMDNGKPNSQTVATTVFDGTECRYRQSKSLTLQRERSAYCEMNAYTNALMWPMTEAERKQNEGDPATVHFLPRMLEAPGWVVGSDHELHSGRACVVARNPSLGRELWLGRDVGYSMVRMVYLNPFPDTASWVEECSEFVDVGGETWLPKRIESIATWKATDRFSAGASKNTITVNAVSVNDVPDDLFHLDPRPGELVKDERHDTIYRFVPPSDTTLDDTVAEVRRRHEDSSAHSLVLWLNLGLIIGAFGVWGVVRFLRR